MNNPWVKFIFKSIIAFGMATSFTANGIALLKIDFGWIIFLGPPIMAVLSYWSGVFDSTPAPTVTPAQARQHADALELALKPPTKAEEKSPPAAPVAGGPAPGA